MSPIAPCSCISNFPPEVLQRIFYIGTEYVWKLSEWELFEPYLIEDEEDENPRDDETPGRFKKDYKPLRWLPELATLIDCAQVCTSWADAIIDKPFWDSLSSSRAYNFALDEPWKVGKRWNRLLRDVPVLLYCVGDHLLANIGKIHTALRRGRHVFELSSLPYGKTEEQISNVWSNIQPTLQRYAPGLIFKQMVCTRFEALESTRVGFLTLKLKKWPLLQSLDIDYSDNDIFTEEMQDDWENFKERTKDRLNADPSFPVLKRLSLCTHIESESAQDITIVAPRVEHCHLNISDFGDDYMQSWDSLRRSPVLRQFLEEDKRYRMYITPQCVDVFKWPGPKVMWDYEEEWLYMSDRRPSPGCASGVLIVERRDGGRCELFLTLDQFAEVEDPRSISIPSI
ncbi:F-box domain containing protein [Gracilaria domingensis]|nr:F-box domain containing protein [Gracilaria domingensis]